MAESYKKPKFIEVVFENCEVFGGSADRDVSVSVRGLLPVDVLENCEQKIYRMSAEEMIIRIRPHMVDLVERVNLYHDITWVYVKFSDGVEIAFSAPWSDLDANDNTYETHYEEPDGTIVIRIVKGEKEMKKYTCPYCGKEYDNLDAFASCVACCHGKDKSSKEEAEAAERNKEFNAVCDAYKHADSLRQAFEEKYHAKILSGGIAELLRMFT